MDTTSNASHNTEQATSPPKGVTAVDYTVDEMNKLPAHLKQQIATHVLQHHTQSFVFWNNITLRNELVHDLVQTAASFNGKPLTPEVKATLRRVHSEGKPIWRHRRKCALAFLEWKPVHRDIQKLHKHLAIMYTHLHNHSIPSYIKQARWVLDRLNDVLTDSITSEQFTLCMVKHGANTMNLNYTFNTDECTLVLSSWMREVQAEYDLFGATHEQRPHIR